MTETQQIARHARDSEVVVYCAFKKNLYSITVTNTQCCSAAMRSSAFYYFFYCLHLHIKSVGNPVSLHHMATRDILVFHIDFESREDFHNVIQFV